jgi:hypothetical protein
LGQLAVVFRSDHRPPPSTRGFFASASGRRE